MTDPYIARVAREQREIGLRRIRDHANSVRRELGLPEEPTPLVKAFRGMAESFSGVKAALQKFARTGKDLNAILEIQEAEITRLAEARRLPSALDGPHTVDPTERAPIYDLTVASLSAT